MGDISNYISDTDNDISETNLISLRINEMRSFSDSKYNLYSAKIDVEIPILDKGSKLEFGGKISSIKTDNNFLFERLTEPNQWLIDPAFTNIANYSEQILGVYALWSGNICFVFIQSRTDNRR
jgi:hypothetical protein